MLGDKWTYHCVAYSSQTVATFSTKAGVFVTLRPVLSGGRKKVGVNLVPSFEREGAFWMQNLQTDHSQHLMYPT